MDYEIQLLKERMNTLEWKLTSIHTSLDFISQLIQHVLSQIQSQGTPSGFSKDQQHFESLLRYIKSYFDELKNSFERHEWQNPYLQNQTLRARDEGMAYTQNMYGSCTERFTTKAEEYSSLNIDRTSSPYKLLKRSFSGSTTEDEQFNREARLYGEASNKLFRRERPAADPRSFKPLPEQSERSLSHLQAREFGYENPHQMHVSSFDDHLNQIPTLPEKVTAAEVIHFWNFGTKEIPPIKTWTNAQKIPQKSKISRWKKIVQIFEEKCDEDWGKFVNDYKDEDGQLMSVSKILALNHHEDFKTYTWSQTVNQRYASTSTITSPPHTKDKNQPNTTTDEEVDTFFPLKFKKHIENENGATKHQVSQASSSEDFQRDEEPDQPLSYVLPKKISGNKVTPLDVIDIWENGTETIPPIRTWTSLQKMTQQSKISRWKKIYSVYINQCRGDKDRFRDLITDEQGRILPLATLCNMFCKIDN